MNTRSSYIPAAALAGWITLAAAVPVAGQTSTLRLQSYTMEQGLAGDMILSLLQDTTGFLWIGTSAGLNRYDGRKFVPYRNRAGDPTSLADDYVRSLFQDRRGTLWVGTKQGGLHRYDPHTDAFERFDLEELLGYRASSVESSPNFIYAIQQIDSSGYWLATGAGLVVLTPGRRQARFVDGSDRTSVRSLFVDADGKVWTGDEAGRIRRRLAGSLAPGQEGGVELEFRVSQPVRSIAADTSGQVWFASQGDGLYRYQPAEDLFTAFHEDDTTAPWLRSDSLMVVDVDAGGALWIGYEQAGFTIVQPDGQSRQVSRHLFSGTDLLDEQVVTFLEDRSGNMWIGTWSGLHRASPYRDAIVPYREDDGSGYLSHPQVVTLEEDRLGRIWLGTWDGWALTFDRAADQFTISTLFGRGGGSGGASIYDILETEDGSLWVATHGDGVSVISPDRGTVRPSARHDVLPLVDKEAISLHEWSRGPLLVGMRDLGMAMHDPATNELRQFGMSANIDSLPTGYVWPIVEDAFGDVWLGAYEGGVVRLDSTLRFLTYPLDGGDVLTNRIYDLAFDTNGMLWVATDAGVRRFDPRDGSTRAYTEADGLAHHNVRGIVIDDAGDLWFTTNDGVSRLTAGTDAFQTFTAFDGLHADRHYARSVLKARDGSLWMGGPEGIERIDPERVRNRRLPAPNLVLSELRVHGEPYRPDDGRLLAQLDRLNLEPDQNRFALRFALLDYTNVGLHRYRYRLDVLSQSRGLFAWLDTPAPGEEWTELTDPSGINFPLLGYGKYEMTVEGINSDGARVTRRLPITIRTPFWATAWFQALMVLALIAIVVAGVSLRARYRIGLDKLRFRIAGTLHDDIGASLSNLTMRISKLMVRIQASDDERAQLERITTLIQQTGLSVRDTEWITKSAYDTLDQLVSRLHAVVDGMFKDHMPYTFVVDPEVVPQTAIDLDLKQHVLLLVKEAINNIQKYARATQVTIQVAHERNRMQITVEDDGVGFDRKNLSRENGLSHMERRVRELGGTITIASVLGRGTRIHLDVPIRHTWRVRWRQFRDRVREAE